MSTQSAASLVPVLDGTNYSIWSKAMKAYLMSLGLWSYVSGTIQEPQLPANPTPEQGIAYLDVKPAVGRRATGDFSCDLINKRTEGPLRMRVDCLSTITKLRGRSYSKVPKLQWKRREGPRKE